MYNSIEDGLGWRMVMSGNGGESRSLGGVGDDGVGDDDDDEDGCWRMICGWDSSSIFGSCAWHGICGWVL